MITQFTAEKLLRLIPALLGLRNGGGGSSGASDGAVVVVRGRRSERDEFPVAHVPDFVQPVGENGCCGDNFADLF